MKVWVIEPVGRGGMAHFAYLTCRALANGGADVTLVTAIDYELRHLPHPFAVDARMRLWSAHTGTDQTNPRRRRVHMGRAPQRLGRAWRLVVEWHKVARLVRRVRPDVIQLGQLNVPGLGFLLRRMTLRGTVLADICHELELRDDASLVERLLARRNRMAFRRFDTVFVLGEQNRNLFLQHYPVPSGRVSAIPHGAVNLFEQRSEPPVAWHSLHRFADHERVVLFFGTIRSSKGLPDLIEAMSLIPVTLHARLLVVGYPVQTVSVAALQDAAHTCGIDSIVRWDLRYVPVEEVAPLMRLADVVVFPYRSASQSGALQVAMAAGKAVIATAVGGLPEVVRHMHNGLLVPPRDPAALAAAIQSVLENASLEASLGKAAEASTSGVHAWPPIADTMLRAYMIARRP